MTMHRSTHGEPAGSSWWSVVRGEGPVIATAIHHGSALRPEAASLMRLADADRIREEDPHTGDLIAAVPTRVIADRSRFEVDLNREREQAVYRTPEQAWGLEVWRQAPDDAFISRSLRLHDRFYDMMGELLRGIAKDCGSFVLLDVHSYNHRRDGAHSPATAPAKAPDINIGTFSMPPGRWNAVLDALTEAIAAFDYRGRQLTVGRDIAFQGKGALTAFVHRNFPDSGCAIALEVKKFFMDEWSGVPYRQDILALQSLIGSLVPVLGAALGTGMSTGSGDGVGSGAGDEHG